MRCTPGAPLALALLCAAAPAARADGPLGPGAPCKPAQEVVDAMAFESGFAVAKGCETLCKKARATCAKHVDRAITCARKSLDDSTFFTIRVSCEGETGSALKQCSAPFEADQKDGRAALETERDARLGDCDTKAQACAESCSAP
jgi:hypothetical protein